MWYAEFRVWMNQFLVLYAIQELLEIKKFGRIFQLYKIYDMVK